MTEYVLTFIFNLSESLLELIIVLWFNLILLNKFGLFKFIDIISVFILQLYYLYLNICATKASTIIH